MESSTEKILRYGSYGVAFFIPWITFGKWVFPHMTSKAFVFYGLISILIALWVYMFTTDTRYRLTKKELLMIAPLLLYVLWMTIAGIAAKNSGLALWGSLMRGTGLMTLYATSLYTLIIASLSKRYEGYMVTLLGWIVGGGAVVAASVWMGDEGFNTAINVLRKGSGGGVTGNSSLAGAYMIFLLGLTALLISMKKKTTWLWILTVFIVCSPLFINVYGLLSGKSILGSARGALLGMVVGTAVATFIYWTFSSKKFVRVIGISGLFIGAIVFGIIWKQLNTSGTLVHEKFVNAASATRFAFWDIAQKAMNERPLVGYGPENFPIAQARYFDPKFLSKDLAFEAWTDHPHNVYYDNGVAAGYPGIALYAVFVGSLIYILYRNKKLTSLQKSILIGTLIGYLLQDLVAFDGFITIFALAVFAGIVYGSSSSIERESKINQKSWHSLLLYGLMAISLIGVYHLSYRPMHKVKMFGEILGSKLNERYVRYQEFLKGSSVGNYWDVSGFGYDEYKLYVRDPVAIKQDLKLLPHAIKDVDAYINYLEGVTQTNKTDYRLYYTLINLYNTKIYLADLPYDAVITTRVTELIQYAQNLAPTDPRIYWLYAQLAAWKGDMPGVIAAYQGGISVDPTLSISHRYFLQFLKATGNQKEYTKALQYAQQQIPGFMM